jgi:DNA processing protein
VTHQEKEAAFLAAWKEAGEYPRLARIWNEEYAVSHAQSGLSVPEDQRLLFPEDESFPESLRNIPLPPLGLFVRGKLPPTNSVFVTIVGTRRTSAKGLRAAHDFAAAMAGVGCVVVSGLAFGADAAAHKGALAVGGKTIAVLASNPSDVTPRTHTAMAEEILSFDGAIISEFHPGHSTQAHHFLQRNRIASGLSQATLIIEAPVGSGATATARFALDQNRDVFCLPGQYDDPLYAVNHALIKEGAILTTSPDDILRHLGLEVASASVTYIPQTEEEKVVLAVLKSAGRPLTVDKIAENGNLDVQSAIITLTQLTLSDAVQETSQGYQLR